MSEVKKMKGDERANSLEGGGGGEGRVASATEAGRPGQRGKGQDSDKWPGTRTNRHGPTDGDRDAVRGAMNSTLARMLRQD